MDPKDAVEIADIPLDEGQVEKDLYDANLPARYRGTEADKRDMIVLGKKQVLRVCAKCSHRCLKIGSNELM